MKIISTIRILVNKFFFTLRTQGVVVTFIKVRSKLYEFPHFIKGMLIGNKYRNKYKYIQNKTPILATYNKTHFNNFAAEKIANQIDQLFIGTRKNAQPLVSVIIPVYNHFNETLNCLKSISETNQKYALEILIIDDCSSDETESVLSRCKSIKFIRNDQNLGYLISCNLASQYASGEFLVFLNNDTIVMPDWLTNLVETFFYNSRTGIVGSKLIYPNGKLQEAGGVIWSEGSGQNYGKGDDPEKPKYNFVRDVDYCSGASICIPAELWKSIGGYDEIYIPAYYEDTDLAFKIRKNGFDVLYQPFSEVIHKEGSTSGTNILEGVKQNQEINRRKFYQRWNPILSNFDGPFTSEIKFRNHRRQKHALVIDSFTPRPDKNSGSIDTYYYLLMLRELGFEVTFISTLDSHKKDDYTKQLQQKGIECIYQPYLLSINNFLSRYGTEYDLFILCRATHGGKFLDKIKKLNPQAKIIFNTVDLHFLREQREKDFIPKNMRNFYPQEGVTEEIELSIMKKADLTIVVSEYEQTLLHSIDPDINVRVVPPPRAIPGLLKNESQRKDILFIGGYLHNPNIDAVLYFTREIWPLIENVLDDCKFLIVGSDIPDEIYKLQSARINVLGHIPILDDIFSKCKLTVAPLRYGAGVKGKIITSLSYGVPCIASNIAAEGMGLTNEENILIGNSPEELANTTIRAYNDIALWNKLSNSGLSFVKQKYSIDIFQTNLKNILFDLGLDNSINDNIANSQINSKYFSWTTF